MNNQINRDDDPLGGVEPIDVEVERVKLDYAIELERLRKARGMSYRDVAIAYGKSPGYISRVFRGDENVTASTMVRLAATVGGRVTVSVNDAHVEAVRALMVIDRGGQELKYWRKNLAVLGHSPGNVPLGRPEIRSSAVAITLHNTQRAD